MKVESGSGAQLGRAALLLAGVAILGCVLQEGLARGRSLRIVRPAFSEFLEDRFTTEERPADALANALFERINGDRRGAGLSPVLWDGRAAEVARGYAARQVRESTFGHYSTDGVPPYMRLTSGGVFGAGAENASAIFTTGRDFSAGEVELALEAHREMLGERPPNDGHRRTILDPSATHVGVAAALAGGGFRLVEEFLCRRFESLEILRLGAAASVRVRGRARPATELQFVTVAREALPSPLRPEEANARRSYHYPWPQVGLVPQGSMARVEGVATVDRIERLPGRRFSFPFEMDRPGLWTFVLHFQAKGESRPIPGGAVTLWAE